MEFKTDFLVEDYIGLCWFQSKVISIVLSVALALALGMTVSVANIALGVVLFVLACPIIIFLQKRRITKRAERRFCAYNTSNELSLKISDSDIVQTSNSGETRLPWEDVYSVRESEDCYYVFLTKRKAFYFPKRSFESDAHREEFLGYVTKYVPEKKVKFKK